MSGVISTDSQAMWTSQGEASVQFGPTFARYAEQEPSYK
jgi:hypothetical protein